MSKVITLGSLFPADLNLNGDQANLLVLQKRLTLRGQQCVTKEITLDAISSVDVVFLGHGSSEAWKFVHSQAPEIFKTLSEFVTRGGKLIAVASGAIAVLAELGKKYESGPHRSEFVNEGGVVGYINTDVQAPVLQYVWQSWFTLLHGPVLAKNPDLADRILLDYGFLNQDTKSERLQRLDDLAADSRKIAFES